MESNSARRFMKIGCFRRSGQGRNRTAAASLFRDVRSITYRQPSMKKQDLRQNKGDAIWTPRGVWTPGEE